MARSKEEIISEMVDSGLFSDQDIKDAASQAPKEFTQGFVKTYEGKPKTLPQKIDVGVNKVSKGIYDLFVNAPYEAVGEALAAPIEQRTMQAPTFFGGQNPANPISVVNKLLRASGGAVSGIPGGTPLESARTAYHAPRGTLGPVEDTAMAVLMGKLSPQTLAAPADAAAIVASKIAKGVSKASSSIGKKAITTAFGPSEKAQSALFNRPAEIKAAAEIGPAQIAGDIQQGHKILSDKISAIEEKQVPEVLRSSPYLMKGAKPKEAILKVITDAKKSIGMTVGPPQKYAKDILDNLSENLKMLKNTVSEQQTRDIVQKVTESINYGKKEYGTSDLALMTVRKKIDGMLKQNLDYKELMKQEVPLQRLKNDLEDNWGLKRSVGEGFIATDATASKLKNVLGDTKEVQSQKTLQALSKETGIDYLKKIKDNKIAAEFKAGAKPNGSRRVKLGQVIGSGIGALASILTGGSIGADIASTAGGGALGGGLMGGADYYGGPMAKNIIQMLSSAKSGTGNVLSAINAKTQGTPYQEIIQRLLKSQPIVAPMLQRNQ